MIELEAIQHWSEEQPWKTSAMVEQDLVQIHPGPIKDIMFRSHLYQNN